MAKRRRKLSKDHEKLISSAMKEIELLLAKINDIHDDDIREEYTFAFTTIKIVVDKMTREYKELGYTEDSDQLYSHYLKALKDFTNEYEI